MENEVNAAPVELDEDFRAAFPEVAAEGAPLPDEVIEAVRGGMTLTAAYARHAVAKANEALLEANNRAKALGSMRGAGGSGASYDAFLAGLEEET